MKLIPSLLGSDAVELNCKLAPISTHTTTASTLTAVTMELMIDYVVDSTPIRAHEEVYLRGLQIAYLEPRPIASITIAGTTLKKKQSSI